MFNPVSTYRIQFHKGFNFDDFGEIIPYLEKLGVKTVYASPIFSSVPGSVHGYDGTNPLQINPEIGTLTQLRVISKKLKAKGISWLQDIVPNHMAYHQDNAWLMDVLENGPSSVYKTFFDQHLSDNLFNGPVMAPFLGADLNDVVANGELKVEQHKDKLLFNYAGQLWPIKPDSYQNTADLTALNQDKERLLQIANDQYYRLCNWKETDHQINYRRFFTVNGLICLNMQKKEVFDEFHQLIKTLVQEDIFQGIRIDHIDGLYNPSGYLSRLRQTLGDETYIVVEKILEKGEEMPAWPIQGNTGYDFLSWVNNVLTGNENKGKFTTFYKTLTHNNEPVTQQAIDKKAYILASQMAGELDNLVNLFLTSGIVNERKIKHVSKSDLRQAIGQFLINCPDYRFYGNQFPLSRSEGAAVKKILSAIKNNHKEIRPAVELIEHAFFRAKNTAAALHFYMRCMQFTGPLMAKGVEDTLMYTYNRFIGHNEVGDAPDAFSIKGAEFHGKMLKRQQRWPLCMNATATHDTKRGEDVRARLNVLPDIADEWLQAVANWQQMNKAIKQIGAPDANDEFFIYQTLMGVYPMPGEEADNFDSRLLEYLEKTMREGKVNSNWAEPNEPYEEAVKQFAKNLLDKRKPFWESFKKLHYKVADYGIVNSLAQVLLKFTAPGMPDTYQGGEHWDLSLVDPDNRRPVDYRQHSGLLSSAKRSSPEKLWQERFNGKIKIWLTRLLLQTRNNDTLVFEKGDYMPLKIKGKFKDRILAFARCYKRAWYLTVVPLNLVRLCEEQQQYITGINWEDTRIILPDDAPGNYRNLLLKTAGNFNQQIAIKEIFKIIPFALLKLDYPDSGRGSGILMPVTSLSSPFGIGDFGTGAKAFADQLHSCCQQYWQLLPLNPVDKKNNYSPYSSYSSVGGNTLLISPEIWVDEGLLMPDDIKPFFLPDKGKVVYEESFRIKHLLFEKAWRKFKSGPNEYRAKEFTEFCKKEAAWLEDHALYVVLKQQMDGLPWYEWPEDFKFRNKEQLANFAVSNQDQVEKEKWLQYQFSKQWRALKDYGNGLDIKFFGDLPFYVSYDSVDVWSQPEIFSLDDKGKMKYVAGVPPDYFSADGQLWGMPVFNSPKLKEQNYSWWVQRIKKNLEMFDLLRLDHFRAFSTFWAVPAGEATAVNGKWEAVPGADLFRALKAEFGKLPFVAEDLGDIDEAVYHLRDEFNLPGMRVLQFAFGDQMPYSPHIPHNYTVNSIAYTGTHDNNTTKGWYKEADKKIIKQLKAYIGSAVKEKNINRLFIRMLMACCAKVVIIPIQDILGLDESARMNIPGAADTSWLWRWEDKSFSKKVEKDLREYTRIYNRI